MIERPPGFETVTEPEIIGTLVKVNSQLAFGGWSGLPSAYLFILRFTVLLLYLCRF